MNRQTKISTFEDELNENASNLTTTNEETAWTIHCDVAWLFVDTR
jgi:hypothetical protein